MSTLTRITTANAPTPSGHYSQATTHGDLVFVSGQLPMGSSGGGNDLSFDTQVRQALQNLLAILDAAGSRPDQVLKVTAFMVGVENWPTFNQVFGELFGEARPSRSVVPVPALHNGYLIEVEAVAVRDTAGAG